MTLIAVEVFGEEQGDAWEDVEQRHAEEDHGEKRHDAFENIHELHVGWSDALQVIGGHGHGWGQEGGLQIERH